MEEENCGELERDKEDFYFDRKRGSYKKMRICNLAVVGAVRILTALVRHSDRSDEIQAFGDKRIIRHRTSNSFGPTIV